MPTESQLVDLKALARQVNELFDVTPPDHKKILNDDEWALSGARFSAGNIAKLGQAIPADVRDELNGIRWEAFDEYHDGPVEFSNFLMDDLRTVSSHIETYLEGNT